VFALLRATCNDSGSPRRTSALYCRWGTVIWKRVPLLVQALGLAAQQVHELLIFIMPYNISARRGTA